MTSRRTYLFLQGPHGPFFWQLAKMLRKTGANVLRVGFNAGDAAFWRRSQDYISFQEPLTAWSETLAALLTDHQITDLVLYGDTRPIHAEAVTQAKVLGLRVHVFEEGYMRPYWVSYERDGSNGYSQLMDISVTDMKNRLAQSDGDMPTPPAQWGDMRQHIFYGALYHWFVMFRNRRYPAYRSHRTLPVHREAALYTKRLLLMPYFALERAWKTRQIKAGGYPYHIALLQLEHDTNFQTHAEFRDMRAFIAMVIDGFANGAPVHHHLIFKAHPLESGQAPLRHMIRDIARTYGIAARVHYLRGGKLAQLLDEASSAVTVNSTAGQQALWRGIPLKSFGKAVYNKTEFVSDQSLDQFFAEPARPDIAAYRDYRQFLLETSQVPGGFYSASGRKQLLRQVIDMMLREEGPYATIKGKDTRHPKRLRVVNEGRLP
ncbi:capsule biosynthesis protein [Yoonia sp.]|uniref:capsule biosynthesis protein n=1 Tax=Yoonia sp. TaxID=2212373 RepID=UPI0023B41ED3